MGLLAVEALDRAVPLDDPAHCGLTLSGGSRPDRGERSVGSPPWIARAPSDKVFAKCGEAVNIDIMFTVIDARLGRSEKDGSRPHDDS